MGFNLLNELKSIVHGAPHAAMTALKDIPLVSDAVQEAQHGIYTPGPDLVHAQEWQPKAGQQIYSHGQVHTVGGASHAMKQFKPMAFRPISSQLNVQSQHSPANLGVPYGVQPQIGNNQPVYRGGPKFNSFNPGAIPMQQSLQVSQPQTSAFNSPQDNYYRPNYNPQLNDNQQLWQ